MKLETLNESQIIVTFIALALNLEFFTVLILTTMLSSMIAGYYLRFQQRKNPKFFDNYEK